LWKENNPRVPIPLPFWAAAETHHHRLSLKFGVAWVAQYLECVAASAVIGLRELAKLQEIEKKGRLLGITKRSRLPAALDAVLRAHIVTAATLAKSIGVTPRAALDLLNELTKAGIVREATGQASWRAFILVG
jgi:HTH DNA binding domain